MVRFPWAIATVLIRTLAPITMVPLASSITTIAALSGSTRRFSICPSVSIASRPVRSIRTVRGSVTLAIVPRVLLMMAAMRWAVVRSGLRRPSHRPLFLSRANGTSFSTVAPLAMRADVGTPRVTDEAAPRAAIAPVVRVPWPTAYTSPSAPSSGVTSKRASGQVRGVAEGRDRDVDTAAVAREGGQLGRHHDGGDVLGGKDGDLVPGVHAEAFEHPDQRFAGEDVVVQLVAGAVQSHDQAVADQLVLAHALDVGDVLDPHVRPCTRPSGCRRAQGQAKQKGGDHTLFAQGFILKTEAASSQQLPCRAKIRKSGGPASCPGRQILPIGTKRRRQMPIDTRGIA